MKSLLWLCFVCVCVCLWDYTCLWKWRMFNNCLWVIRVRAVTRGSLSWAAGVVAPPWGRSVCNAAHSCLHRLLLVSMLGLESPDGACSSAKLLWTGGDVCVFVRYQMTHRRTSGCWMTPWCSITPDRRTRLSTSAKPLTSTAVCWPTSTSWSWVSWTEAPRSHGGTQGPLVFIHPSWKSFGWLTSDKSPPKISHISWVI